MLKLVFKLIVLIIGLMSLIIVTFNSSTKDKQKKLK